MLRSSRGFGGRAVSALSALAFERPSMTRQSDAVGTDIGLLVKRYRETGIVPPTPVPPKFGDFKDAPDFSTLMQRIVQARESFEALPSKLRSRFVTMENFVAFCSDPANVEEMVKLNLAVMRQTPEPPKPQEVVIVGEKGNRRAARVDEGTADD